MEPPPGESDPRPGPQGDGAVGVAGAGVRGDGRLRLPGLPPGAAAAGAGAGAAGAPRLRPPHRPPRRPPQPRGPGAGAAGGGGRGGRGGRGAGAGGGRRGAARRLPRGRLGPRQPRGHRPRQRAGDEERDRGVPGAGRALPRLHQQHGGGGAQHPRGPLPAGGRGLPVPRPAHGAVPPQQGPGRAPRPGGQRQPRGRGGPAGDGGPAPHGDLWGATPPDGPVLPAGEGGRGVAAPNSPAPRRARPRLRRQRGLDARAGGAGGSSAPGDGGRRSFLLLRRLPLRRLRGVQHVAAGAGRAAFGGTPAPRRPPGPPGTPQRRAAGAAAAPAPLRPPPQPLHPGRRLHPLQRPHRQGSAPFRLPAPLLLGTGSPTHRQLDPAARRAIQALIQPRRCLQLAPPPAPPPASDWLQLGPHAGSASGFYPPNPAPGFTPLLALSPRPLIIMFICISLSPWPIKVP